MRLPVFWHDATGDSAEANCFFIGCTCQWACPPKVSVKAGLIVLKLSCVLFGQNHVRQNYNSSVLGTGGIRPWAFHFCVLANQRLVSLIDGHHTLLV